MKVFYIFVIINILSISVFTQGKIPQFKNYSISDVYAGKNAKPIITKSDRIFKTRLTEGANEKPNFAGRYILSVWGCGARCLMGAVIDAKTGKISWLPGSVCCWEGFDDNFEPIEFRLNSRLIILSGFINESENGDGLDSHFYEFKNGKFIHIKTIRRKDL
jgi:hypothetical protein